MYIAPNRHETTAFRNVLIFLSLMAKIAPRTTVSIQHKSTASEELAPDDKSVIKMNAQYL